MSKIFKTNINKSFDFEIDANAIPNLDAVQVSKSQYHILQRNISYNAEIIQADFNKKIYQVKVNNNAYNVNIFNDLDVIIKNMGFTIGTTKHIDSIKAPMPGLILELKIKVGQKVKENDLLFILEAMKMENSVTSPRAGVIKSISVKNGDPVDKNQLLIEFE